MYILQRITFKSDTQGFFEMRNPNLDTFLLRPVEGALNYFTVYFWWF